MLGDVSFGLLTGLEQLEVAADSYVVRLGFFPGGVDYRNVTKANAVKNFGFFNGSRGERFVLSLESERGVELSRPPYCSPRPRGIALFPRFPEGVNLRDQVAREIKEHGGDGLRGVSKEKSTGES